MWWRATRTSLRQDVLAELDRRGQRCRCIRCREVRGQPVQIRPTCAWTTWSTTRPTPRSISSRTSPPMTAWPATCACRCPHEPARLPAGLPDLAGAALVREVHVYGQSLAVGAEQTGAAQHIGLGTALLQHAEQIARQPASPAWRSSPPSARAATTKRAASSGESCTG